MVLFKGCRMIGKSSLRISRKKAQCQTYFYQEPENQRCYLFLNLHAKLTLSIELATAHFLSARLTNILTKQNLHSPTPLTIKYVLSRATNRFCDVIYISYLTSTVSRQISDFQLNLGAMPIQDAFCNQKTFAETDIRQLSCHK